MLCFILKQIDNYFRVKVTPIEYLYSSFEQYITSSPIDFKYSFNNSKFYKMSKNQFKTF